MRRIIQSSFSILTFNSFRFQYHKAKPDLQIQSTPSKNTFFNQKDFSELINIVKNPENPYPKSPAYYQAVFESIMNQSKSNPKIMTDHGEVIHIFLQQLMQRIKSMSAKQLSSTLSLLRFRPKSLRFQKQFLITMHVRFQTRMKQLIQINEFSDSINPQQVLTIEDIKSQIQGLFYLKKNTLILNRLLSFSYRLICKHKQEVDASDEKAVQQFKSEQKLFYGIITAINQNLDDTIDPVRQSIAQFAFQNYKKNKLPQHRQVLRMIVKCKLYKNYPIVRNQDWIHSYIYNYISRIIKQQKTTEIQQIVSVLKSVVNYSLHIDPQSRQGFVQLIQEAFKIAKTNLLAISYANDNVNDKTNDKQQLLRQINTISLYNKLIPSFLYLKNYYKINMVEFQEGNKVNSQFIKALIDEIKPVVKKFIICYFQNNQKCSEGGLEAESIQDNQKFIKGSIDSNINLLHSIIEKQDQPSQLLLRCLENLLNTVTVLKDYNIVTIDPEFSLQLIQTEAIYCILCRNWVQDQVRYLRLLQHSVFMISQFTRHIQAGNSNFEQYRQRVKRIKTKLQEELAVYDNMQRHYKQFTVLRLVAILKCLDMNPKYLNDYYKNVKLKKPNIYVETLSRTMLKVFNYEEIIEGFQLMYQGKIPVKEIQLGRIVFLSSKQPQLLKYWMHKNRKHFISKICFCRRIMNNIVSIIRMDNLQINRNSIQLLSEIVIENKLFQIENQSLSNHQESNAVKKILCNNFSILFRYSKLDSLTDDVFIVHKTIPTIFRSKFSHIQLMKILSFSTFVSEEQSIFYVNRQNKNALFKFVIMLMAKQPYFQTNRQHYLLESGYNNQSVILDVVSKIIRQYWPDNKMTNKGMPFYAQFLNYYTKINKFKVLVQNQNSIFLMIKQILLDFKQFQNKQELSHIISRMQTNYERLHFLLLFENEKNLNNTLENVINSMNFVIDVEIFTDFVSEIERKIRIEIEEQLRKTQEQKINSIKVSKSWKSNQTNKHLINMMIMNRLKSLDNYTDYDIMSLLTIDIMVHGMRDQINENMALVLQRLLKINPLSVRYSLSSSSSSPTEQQSQPRKKYPYELFKTVISNLNIYISNRQKRLQTGKQLFSNQQAEQISNKKICEWLIKCILTYAKQITNNEEISHIMNCLNSWSLDLLALINNRFLTVAGHLNNWGKAYFDVEILYVLFAQNVTGFNATENISNQMQMFSNEKLLSYIQLILNQFEETHIVNNYGIYFQNEGQKILNTIKALLMMIISHEKEGSKIYQSSLETLKNSRIMFEEFRKIVNKTNRYNKLCGSGKYLHNSNESYDEIIERTPSAKKSSSTTQASQQAVNLKTFSKFTEILEIMHLIKFNKLQLKNFISQHKEQMKKVNKQISKRQKILLIHSQLTYFTDTQKLIQQKQYPNLGVKLYSKINIQNQKEGQKNTIFYIINQKQSMLYDFAYKKRKRLCGQEQLIVDYLETIIKSSNQADPLKSKELIQIKIIPNHLSKTELKKFIEG